MYICINIFQIYTEKMNEQIEMMSDPHGYLSRKCTEKGISLTELCRRAGADRSVVQRWRVKNTLSFLILGKLVKELDSIQKPTLKHAGNIGGEGEND